MPVPPPAPTTFPVIKINSSTGSNTAASGAGPSTALSGTAAATASSTTVTLLVDNPNLSGVATDGTACLWVGSSSGRKFSKITGVNNTVGVKTVTVAVAYANTESGKNWGIGGKRLSAAGSTEVFVDWGLGWQVDQQTSETISASITLTGPTPDNTNPPPLYTSTVATTWGTQPVIDTTTASLIMFKVGTTGVSISNLAFKQTSGTPGKAFNAQPGNGVDITWSACIFDGFSQALDGSNNVPNLFNACILEGSEVKNCTGLPGSGAAISFNQTGGGTQGHVHNCFIHDNAGAVYGGESGVAGLHITGTVFANNNTSGSANPIIMMDMGNVTFKNNTVYNCGSSSTTAGALSTGSGTIGIATIENNIFYGCSGFAIKMGSQGPSGFVNRNNAYGGNGGTGGANADLNGFLYGPGDVIGISNPFVSGSDFGLNATVGAGALCKAVASVAPNASANTPGDLGAIPSGGGSSSTGGATRGRVFTGM